MLRLPFHCEIPRSNAYFSEMGHSISEKKLNDEWKIVFTRKENTGNMFASQCPHPCIKICRQTTSDEMLVSGTLSYQSSGQAVSTQEFSKLIKPGSSFIIINLSEPLPTTSAFGFGQLSHSGPCTLDGIVYITSSSDKCTSDLAIKECKTCSQLESLVQLSKDFEVLLNPQTSCYADVNLKCGDALIPAHKIILSTRSPVFADKLKENYENKVDVADMDTSVVRAMLVYIYTGKTYSLTVPSASDLLRAANKYELDDLKRVCCDFLKENVSLQNVLRIIDLGDKYSEDLKTFAVDYFCNKCTDIPAFQKTEEWKTLCEKKPALIIHVLTSSVIWRDQKLDGVQAK